MINPDSRPNERVHYAWFFMHPTAGPHYSAPLRCNPMTPEGCLREIAEKGRLDEQFARNLLRWDGVWFDIGLIPVYEATPPHDYYDSFAPIAHPGTGSLMAVLLRVREDVKR